MDLFAPKHLIVILLVVLLVVPYWKIFGKAGFSPWLALGMLVPLANFVLLFYLAFATWPRDRLKDHAET